MAVWYSGVTVALLVQRWPVPMLQVRDWREQHAPPQRFAESIARLLDQPRYLSRESSQILQNLIPPRHSQHLSSWRSGKVPLPPSFESGAQVIAAIRLSTLNKSWYWPLRQIRPRHATICKVAGQFKRRGYSGAPACVYLHGMVFLALNIAEKQITKGANIYAMHCNATFLNSFIVSVISWPSHHLWHCSQLPVILRHQLVCPCVHGPDPKELPDQPSNPTWQECSKIQTSGYIETHESIEFPGTRSPVSTPSGPRPRGPHSNAIKSRLVLLDLPALVAFADNYPEILKNIENIWKSIKDYRDQRKVILNGEFVCSDAA